MISEVVSDDRARILLYQAEVNLRLFIYSAEQLNKEFDALNFEDLARANTCHMTEGIFGELKHKSQMLSHKQAVIGFLLAVVTAGHRFTRSLFAARRKDQGEDWKILKYDFRLIEKRFHRTRNFLEHLDEALALDQGLERIDCTFSRHGILSCKEDSEEFEFDFRNSSLDKTTEIFDKVIEMLKKREKNNP